MEPIEEGERTISIFEVKVDATVVVKEFGLENFKERDAVEGAKVVRGSRRTKSILRILVTDIRFRRTSDSQLRVASNKVTDD